MKIHSCILVIIILSIFLISCDKVLEKVKGIESVEMSGNYVMYNGPFTTIQVNPDKSVWVSFSGTSSLCSITTNRILFINGTDTTELSISTDGKFINYKHKDNEIPKLAIKVEDTVLWSAYQSYFKADFIDAIPKFEKYLQVHSENTFVHICLSNCLFQQGKYNESKTELEKTDNQPELQSNPGLKSAYKILKYCLKGKEKSAAGLNACDGYEDALKSIKYPTEYNSEVFKLQFNSNPLSPEDRIIIQKYIAGNMDSIQTFLHLPEKSEYYDFKGSYSLIGRNFLKNQVLARAVILYARLLMEDGQIRHAVDANRRVTRMGQQMTSSPYLYQLIGAHIRTWGAKNMGLLYSQNRITNLEDANYVLLVSKELYRLDSVSTPKSLTEMGTTLNSSNVLREVLTRMHVAETNLILMETTAAIKAFQIKEGKSLKTFNDLVPTYLSEIPLDTFGKNPIVYKPDYSYMLYSYGSDTTDDRGEITYDPTNGTLSRGDLVYP